MEKLLNHRHILSSALRIGGQDLGIGWIELGGACLGVRHLCKREGKSSEDGGRIWDKSGEWEKYWDGQ